MMESKKEAGLPCDSKYNTSETRNKGGRPKKIRLLPAKFAGLKQNEAVELLQFVYKMSLDAAIRHVKLGWADRIYITNYAKGPSNYHVIVKNGPEVPKQGQLGVALTEIEVRTFDGKGIFDQEDLQNIKDAVLGPESEAIELYPARSRLIRDPNVRYIYGVSSGDRIPVGYN